MNFISELLTSLLKIRNCDLRQCNEAIVLNVCWNIVCVCFDSQSSRDDPFVTLSFLLRDLDTDLDLDLRGGGLLPFESDLPLLRDRALS